MEELERIPLKKVKLTVNTCLAYFNLQRSFKGLPPWSINEVARKTGTSPTTIHRLFREENDPKAAQALSLDLATRLCSVLECEVSDLMTTELVEGVYLDSIDKKSSID
ncbi:MAG: hypothetical protein CMP84_13420 [Gammaproteobacteria bacterium]|nr:hypothetical protein [Gammaproteobacteria bacterium]|tara:strand:+ start:646 stop:969 length:324 start_codon:yes stop_codon:yes gene_type:complete